MARTYSQLAVHAVFSTRRRAAFIKPAVQPRLYEYIGGIVRSEKGTLYAIGGMPDHVHLLLGYPADRAISDLMRVIKAKSSLGVTERFRARGRSPGRPGTRRSR